MYLLIIIHTFLGYAYDLVMMYFLDIRFGLLIFYLGNLITFLNVITFSSEDLSPCPFLSVSVPKLNGSIGGISKL